MELNTLEKPLRLQIYQCLRGRRPFSQDEEMEAYQLERGYDGEVQFKGVVVKHVGKGVVIVYSLFVDGDGWYQIDCILITHDKLYLLDVKNYSQPLTYHNGDLYINNKKMSNNPLHRLERAASLLKQILNRNGYFIEIIPRLVLINPEMVFYGNQQSLPILLYPQIQSFLEQIPSEKSYYARQIGEFLLSIRSKDDPFARRNIRYEYEELRKGVRCGGCGSLELDFSPRKFRCLSCNESDSKENAVFRNIYEYRVLWPDKKLSPTAIVDWCDGKVSRQRIHAIIESYKNKLFIAKV